jgi:FAD/FMN-containing dehydrogenase
MVGTFGLDRPYVGGGVGYQTRRHGMAIDNLIAAKIVTADGQVRTVSKEENPDLFWAVRGAGTAFGMKW